MATDAPLAAQRAWIAQVAEAALEPELPICDPHHHLWLDDGHTGWPYTLEDLHAALFFIRSQRRLEMAVLWLV